MDSADVLDEEKKFLSEAKYRNYMSNIDKALRNFEYSSEWADLISALGKLGKAISSNTQYQIIPRRIKISKRLAQCMHPALPSGVHLKTLETYGVIFNKTGPERLATELFIYSAGLFPLLGYAAMNVRPALLGIYETYFVPLGDKLRPALSGFLSGVLPGYENGLDHFDRTNSLLSQICNVVGPTYFYTVLWECIATNSDIRLPAINYLLDHFNKPIGMDKQLFIIGHDRDKMVLALCICLNDSVILVQRNTLEFILISFPIHTNLLKDDHIIKLVTNALSTILRRDMSLNRRLFSWLLGTEVNKNSPNFDTASILDEPDVEVKSYFEKHSKMILVQAYINTLRASLETGNADLKPFRIMISLLDKAEIGSAILDYVLCDIIRSVTLCKSNVEVLKSANLLFASLDPAYIWCFITSMYEKICLTKIKNDNYYNPDICVVGSGEPNLKEICHLTEHLLETISLEIYNETTRVYLPKVFLAMTKMLTIHIEKLDMEEIEASLKLCMKIVSRVQPMISSPVKVHSARTSNPSDTESRKSLNNPLSNINYESYSLEKSKSDSKLNNITNDKKSGTTEGSRESLSSSGKNSFQINFRKKKSKSYSKLSELDSESSNIDDNFKLEMRQSLSDADSPNTMKKILSESSFKLNTNDKDNSDNDNENFNKSNSYISNDNNTSQVSELPSQQNINIDVLDEPDQTFMDLQHDMEDVKDFSVLEKCIRQYETFFGVFLLQELFHFKTIFDNEKYKLTLKDESQIIKLSLENTFNNEEIFEDLSVECIKYVDGLFDTLKINVVNRSEELEQLLSRSMVDGSPRDKVEEKCKLSETLKNEIERLINMKLKIDSRKVVKLAANLLVEMSTFPNCKGNLVFNKTEKRMPLWLKLLCIVSCYARNDVELQLSTINTLFDLISLMKSQIEYTTNPGVTFVVMIPLLKYGDIQFLEQNTRIFHIITSELWCNLGEANVDHSTISSLLYQLHNCLESGLVETIIGCHILGYNIYNCNDLSSSENTIDAFSFLNHSTLIENCLEKNTVKPIVFNDSKNLKRFEILWDAGRERQTEGFDKTMLKVLDRLSLPHYMYDRTFVTTWLQSSLLKGDLHRLIKPLYRILLSSNSKRISISDMIQMKNGDKNTINDGTKEAINPDNERLIASDICAISSEQGNIKYHVDANSGKKHSPVKSLQKKIFGVTLSSKNKTSNFVSDKTAAFDHVSSASSESSRIGLIINPLDNSLDFTKDEKIKLKTNSEENLMKAKDFNNETDSVRSSISFGLETDDIASTSSDKKSNSSKNILNKSKSDLSKSKTDLSSTTKNISNSTNSIKRFVGDCESVTDMLTQHERAKNRKTYQLAQENLSELSPTSDTQSCYETDNDSSLQNLSLSEQLNNSKTDKTDNPNSSFNRKSALKSSGGSTGRLSETKSISSDNGITLTINCEDKRRSLSFSTKKNELNEEVFEKSKNNLKILRKNAGNSNNNGKKSNMKRFSNSYQDESLQLITEHILIYSGIYDTKQALYAFQTIRNIIACDPRTFLCLAITTSVNSTSLKQMLLRHKKSIDGKGFDSNITNSECVQSFRGCMYLEVLIILCLYYARGYFSQESYDSSRNPPTNEDILGNCQLQLQAFDLLTFISQELIVVVKGMGKGLASYIADLMERCKLQKLILQCLNTSVHSYKASVSSSASSSAVSNTSTSIASQILNLNLPKDEILFAESIQVQMLKCLTAIIKLEFEVFALKADNAIVIGNSKEDTTSSSSNAGVAGAGVAGTGNGGGVGGGGFPLVSYNLDMLNLKYQANCTISHQSLFLSAVIAALQKDSLQHLHRKWTELITSCLNSFTAGSLTSVVINVLYQLCSNIDSIAKNILKDQATIYSDYVFSQLEAITVLCHYCLLDHTQQTTLSNLFNQAYPQTSVTSQSFNTSQLINNIVHSFMSSNNMPSLADSNTVRSSELLTARTTLLRHLPRLLETVAVIWDSELGSMRQVKQQMMEFLSPISLHHGINFLAAVAVAWQERGDANRKRSNELRNNPYSIQEQFLRYSSINACEEQLSLITLVSNIRVMPMDSLIHTLHMVMKTPPATYRPSATLNIELSCLEFFYFYMKSAPPPQLSDSWNALLALLRDGISLYPQVQFVLVMLLNEFVQRAPQLPFQDKKDMRDLHDITARLIDSLSTIAGACLEQTTWLRRNLAVKEDISDIVFEDSGNNVGNQQNSLQAQSILASVVANLLDVVYGSQDKEKVVAILTTLLYNTTPYLRNHSTRNIPYFFACSVLLANLSGYQYTRKAWRKEVFDLLLDNAFFQMDSSCLSYWKQIMDSLMTYDNTTFRELMNRVSFTPAGSLNIFSSREQEYEQRSMLLKRLAFVIFCSEFDQYNKYMPEIQEQLVNSLRLFSMVPSVQSAVFLCFRVLLLRMSSENVTSLWPIIIAEMVQVFLSIEQELKNENDEISSKVRLVASTSDTSLTSTLSTVSLPWRAVQLETCKLLEMGCVLPATKLPQFQMYRWAFVGMEFDVYEDTHVNILDDHGDFNTNYKYTPHIRRIARLMDMVYNINIPDLESLTSKPLILTFQQISSLQDLHIFFTAFSTSCIKCFENDAEATKCLNEIEIVLGKDFLEKMPTSTTPK